MFTCDEDILDNWKLDNTIKYWRIDIAELNELAYTKLVVNDRFKNNYCLQNMHLIKVILFHMHIFVDNFKLSSDPSGRAFKEWVLEHQSLN